MEHSKLSAHRFRKGKFITPMNAVMSGIGQHDSWYHGRVPEYLWLGLILDHYGRDVGLSKCNLILKSLRKIAPEMVIPRLSSVFALDEKVQTEFYDCVLAVVPREVLCPLTCIFTYSHHPAFTKAFLKSDVSVEDRFATVVRLLKEISDHQSHLSTDIRFLVLYLGLLSGKMHMPEEMLLNVLEYPKCSHDDERMRKLRPTIRAMELAFREVGFNQDTRNKAYLQSFWKDVSRMGDCELFYLEFAEPKPDAKDYSERVKRILEYYAELQGAANPIDNKMLVLLGIATYSFKRLSELVRHELYHEISGRGIIRVLVEDYIMMKYLLKNEADRSDIWSEFQSYGIGQYKIIVAKWRDSGKDLKTSHVAYEYMSILVNEHMDEEFLDMDTSYFDKQPIRLKAEDVGEKELYSLYYDYDSAFEHGLWGAIRESSLIKCNSSVHQYHCVPDIEDRQKLKSVWHDCVRVMDMTLGILEGIYGLRTSVKDGDNCAED